MFKKTFLAILTATGVLSFCQISHAQMFFEADWVFMDRDNDGDGNIVAGPESLGLGNSDYDFSSGYRLILGGQLGCVDIDSSWTQLDTWESSDSGTFNGDVLFDDTAGGGFFPAGGNSLNRALGLSQAATLVGAEIDETEFLRATDPMDAGYSPRWTSFSESNYSDFELNIGTNRECRRWRASVGYRHIELDEMSGVTLGGFFDAVDAADGTPVGGQPNDQLAGSSLAAVGFDPIVAGSLDGFATPAGPDSILYQVRGDASNELDGAQATFAGRLFDGDWVTIEGYGKAGIFHNNMHGSVGETVVATGNGNAAYRRRLSDSEIGAAFAGNLGFTATVSLTDYINLVTGYEALFLSGVALGPDQINGLSTNLLGNRRYSVENDGSVIAHGGRLGLEILW
ncbi:hypothetical protein AB1L42_15935 [Thalassoglobus sp. JC818]|uniref:hypothetical protein n=1 Tax=Thalassoglobus sp. JC818 TaxID=3232136 RepID=UPI0034584CF3